MNHLIHQPKKNLDSKHPMNYSVMAHNVKHHLLHLKVESAQIHSIEDQKRNINKRYRNTFSIKSLRFLSSVIFLSNTFCFLLLICGNCAALDKEQTFTCPIHKQIRMNSKGKCPICLRNLIPESAMKRGNSTIVVPEGQLKQFCEKYITTEIEESTNPTFDEAWLIVSCYKDIYGKKSISRLRELLSSKNLGYVSSAAKFLGEFSDKKSFSKLKAISQSLSGQLVSSFHCPIHMIEVYELPGKCQHCNSKLVESINYNTLMAYLYVTVSLYKLGEPEAFERLLEIAMKPYGWVAFDEIARANPRQAIAFLESFKTSKNKHIRAHATISLAQQEEKYVQVTTQYLASDDQSVRSSVLAYLAEKRDPRLKHVLQETYEKKGIPFSEKISAARGLILLGEKKPLNQLIMVLDNTDASQYHRLVLLELGYVGKMEHLPILERIIEKKPNDRLWAVSAVIKILKRYTEQLTEDTSAN